MARTDSCWPGFSIRPAYLRLVMEEMALGRVFASVLWFPPLIIIPQFNHLSK